jgi:dienelactone hydrolase
MARCRIGGACAVIFAVMSGMVIRAASMTNEQVVETRQRIRANFFIDPLPAIDARTHRRFEVAPGVSGEAVTYATQFNQRVPGILYLPNPLPAGGKIPAFVVVNGHGGDKFSWYAFYTGVAFARGGAAVLTYDQAGEGERSGNRASGTREHDRLQGDERMARRLAGLMLSDIMQAVTYLSARPEVDPKRIAAGGYSLGSFVLSIAGAIEPRLRATVMVGGGNLDGPEGYWDRSKPMCQGLPYRSLNFLGDRAAVIFALQAARGPTLIWNGREDNVVNVPNTHEAFFDDLRSRVVALRGKSDGVFEYGFIPEASHRPHFVTAPVVRWLERQIDFPLYTEDSIEALPKTHVSEWTGRNGVAIDKLYATEAREGGTRAIRDDVPAISREQLYVFAPAEWEQMKERLTFAAWTKAAKAAAGK